MTGMGGPGMTLLLVVLGLVALARVAELFVARAHSRGAAGRGERPRPEAIFVAMVALHASVFVVIPLEVVLLERGFRPWLAGLACAGLLACGLARAWTLRTLGARWNVRIVKPDAVVVEGPYRFVRHPNYAIVIVELALLPLLHGAWLSLLVLGGLNALILAVRIPAEERVLQTVEGYREAMGGKPRFIPRWGP